MLHFLDFGSDDRKQKHLLRQRVSVDDDEVMRLRGRESSFGEVIDAPFAQRKAQLQVDAWGSQTSTPTLIECLLVEEEIKRYFAVLRQKGVARIVTGRWIVEEIGVIHLDPFIAVMPEFWRVPFPLRIMVCDVTQLKLGVLPKGAPRELQRLDIGLRKDALIDFRHRGEMISILSANEAARVTPF